MEGGKKVRDGGREKGVRDGGREGRREKGVREGEGVMSSEREWMEWWGLIEGQD